MGKTVSYVTYYQSPLGKLKLEGHDTALTGLCFVGDEEVFTTSHRVGVLGSVCLQLDEYFDGSRTQFDLPIELDGTEFQRAVWRYAATLSYGSTCSYRQLAERIGRLTACRAVAQALGKNPLLLVVPCHRVVGDDGALRGYSGGVERKEWLLNHEKE